MGKHSVNNFVEALENFGCAIRQPREREKSAASFTNLCGPAEVAHVACSRSRRVAKVDRVALQGTPHRLCAGDLQA